MYSEQHPGKYHSIRTGNKSVEYSANFKYFGMTITNLTTYIKKEVKSKKCRLAFRYKIFSSVFIFKKIKIKIYRNAILSLVSYCGNGYIELNLLKTRRRPLYLKTQFVPRCKHFSSRLQKPISLCCKWHKSLFVLR